MTSIPLVEESPIDFTNPSVLVLDTLADWTSFEASLLTVGLFERLPFGSNGSNANSVDNDDKIKRLWRCVITRALFDILRGPTVDASQPPRKGLGRPSKAFLKRKKHYDEVVLRRANAIYRDAVHWVHGGKTVMDWLDEEEGSILERDSDFVVVCDLAGLDPGLVKNTFVKLVKMKMEVTQCGNR